MQLTNLYVTLSSIMPKIKQTDTHFNHVPACLISVFIQFLFALPLLYQCKYTLKYNEEAQQDCCYNVGPGADQFSIGFNQSRNRTIYRMSIYRIDIQVSVRTGNRTFFLFQEIHG